MSNAIVVIAHRGASGYLPEHTLEAKALAYGQGADFLEQDLVATRDGSLIVFHDIHLEAVTDVARRFPARSRADGHYYAVDFDIDEIRQLNVLGRREPPPMPGNPHAARLIERYRIPTLEEELSLVARLNRATGRSVGVYPEIKHPKWHRKHGIDITQLLIEQLAVFGYRDAGSAAFVQCFDASELRRVRDDLGAELPLIQLVDASPAYSRLLTRSGLAELSRYVQGLGPSYAQLVGPTMDAGSRSAQRSTLAAAAQDTGLLLHPYTFQREQLPPYAPTLEALLETFYTEIAVDGVFCDFPDVAVRVRDSVARA